MRPSPVYVLGRGEAAPLPRATLEVVRLPGRTRSLSSRSPGEGKDTVLLCGHLDKLPEIVGQRAWKIALFATVNCLFISKASFG